MGRTAETVTMGYAAKRLGYRAGELELGVLLGEVRTVPGADPADRRRLSAEELRRLEDIAGPGAGRAEGPRARPWRALDAAEARSVLGVPPRRFALLARAGCLAPVQFTLSCYRTLVWLYLPADLLRFAALHPHLLDGPSPAALRRAVDDGADLRARHWRSRRAHWLMAQYADPWERAAARSLLLGEDALRRAVPDTVERGRLLRLRPRVPLAVDRADSSAAREATLRLGTARAEDEVRHVRLLLDADLEAARASERGTSCLTGRTAAVPRRPRRAASRPAATAGGVRRLPARTPAARP